MNAQSKSSGGVVANTLGVIVIIVVLAAVLFPMFAGEHEYPHKSTCQSNLKECAIALHTYWNDYDGHLPSSFLVSHAPQWDAEAFRHLGTRIGELPPANENRLQTWPQILYGHMKRHHVLSFRTQLDKKNTRAQTSYWWKLAVDKASYGWPRRSRPRRTDTLTRRSDTCSSSAKAGTSAIRPGCINGAPDQRRFLDSHVGPSPSKGSTSGDPLNARPTPMASRCTTTAIPTPTPARNHPAGAGQVDRPDEVL